MDLSTIKVPAGVTNPDAYRRAVANKIANRQFEAQRKRAAMKVIDWLGEKPSRIALMDRLQAEAKRNNEFYCSLLGAFRQWGCLTEKQEAALRASFEKADARALERVAANAEAAGVSQHVGTVGLRSDFRLKLERQTYLASYDFWINVLTDPDGNRFTYAGQQLDVEVGKTALIRATVKGHDIRDGVKETKINRPAVQTGGTTEAEFLAARHSTGSAKPIKL